MKIQELNISARARMCLLSAGYEEIEELKDTTDEELLKIRNLNAKGVLEIRRAIGEYELEKESEDEIGDANDENIYNDLGKINSYYFMASYPIRIQNIARKKEDAWEYRLFIESAIYKYESLQEHRNQGIVFWENGEYLNCIENIKDFTDFIKMQANKLQEFIQEFAVCMNRDVKEAWGEPGETGDMHKIIEATEKLMQIYEDMIVWKLSFGNIDADHMYRNLIEQFCMIIDSALHNFDVLYTKLQVAKRQFEDLLAGLINEEELYIDLHISFEVNVDDFEKEVNIWRTKYLDKNADSEDELIE